jgi:zinc finger protein
MAFTCEACGFRSTEVKTGGPIADKAKRIIFKVLNDEDFDRDIFKSETAVVRIPELGVELNSGTLGGVYSTIEGLFEKILNCLKNENPFVGDSTEVD